MVLRYPLALETRRRPAPAVRELYVGRLTHNELDRLARLFEKALPGVVSAPVWPPPTIGAEP
jgi:hypothetical protein